MSDVLAYWSDHHNEWYLVTEDMGEEPDGRNVPGDQCDDCGGWVECAGQHPQAVEMNGAWWRPAEMRWQKVLRPLNCRTPYYKRWGEVVCDCGARYDVDVRREDEVVFP